MIAIAGGDGTVRRVIKKMMKPTAGNKNLPIGVLALGTANNIAKTINLSTKPEEVIRSWKGAAMKKVDIGLVQNVPGVEFFLEGFGFGIFPYLMKEMKKAGEEYQSPEQELKAGLEKLHKILLSYQPRQCQLAVDGTDHSGKFYMVEVMNIRSIGPNMELAPLADPGDGEFEIVLVPEAHKEKFFEFLLHKLANGEDSYQFHTLKGKKISIRWNGTRVHADDKMLKLEKEVEVKIEVKAGALTFLVNANETSVIN